MIQMAERVQSLQKVQELKDPERSVDAVQFQNFFLQQKCDN